MRIYVAHPGSIDYRNELYLPLEASVLAEEHEFIFPHENESNKIDTKEISRNSDLVLAEVSEPSTGEGIEIGRAEMMGIPILFVYKSGSKISSSLKYVGDTFIEYKDANDLISKIETFIRGRA